MSLYQMSACGKQHQAELLLDALLFLCLLQCIYPTAGSVLAQVIRGKTFTLDEQ